MVFSRFRLLQTNTTCSVQLVRRELKHSEGEWNKYQKCFSFLNNLCSDDDDQDEEDPWHDKTAELSWGGTAAAKHRFK